MAPVDAPAPWARARFRAELAITPEAIVLGGRFALDVLSEDGEGACTVEADWLDGGADLPLVDCPGCTWVASLVLVQPRISGPDCQDLDSRSIEIGASAFGWRPRANSSGGELLRWNRGRWLPFAIGVDELEPRLRVWAELPTVLADGPLVTWRG